MLTLTPDEELVVTKLRQKKVELGSALLLLGSPNCTRLVLQKLLQLSFTEASSLEPVVLDAISDHRLVDSQLIEHVYRNHDKAKPKLVTKAKGRLLKSKYATPFMFQAELRGTENSSAGQYFALLNPRCPADLVAEFTESKNTHSIFKLRLIALAHPNCPLSILQQKYKRPSNVEKLALLRNPKLPSTWLEQEFPSNNDDLNEAIVTNPNCPLALLNKIPEQYPKFMYWLLQNPNCPPDILTQAWYFSDYWQTALKNPNCSMDILLQASLNPSEIVRTCVVHNPKANRKLLTVALLSGDRTIAGYATIHPNAPLDILRAIKRW